MRNIVTDRIQKKEVWMHASCYVLKETVAFLWKYTDGDFSHVCGVWHKVRSNEAF